MNRTATEKSRFDSRKYPQVCACCGNPFDNDKHKIHPTSNPSLSICEWCWRKPHLFFPGKVTEYNAPNVATFQFVAKLLSKKRIPGIAWGRERGEPMGSLSPRKPPTKREGERIMSTVETIKVPALRFEQKKIKMYVGKMKAKDILQTWDVAEFVEEHMKAYQRHRYNSRTKEIAKFVKECQVPIVPPILVSLREGAKFTSTNGDMGFLEVPKYHGAIWVVDGQHRIGGFATIAEYIENQRMGRQKLSEKEVSKLQQLLDFEVPLAFFDAESATENVDKVINPGRKVNLLKELGKDELEPEDVERVFFFVINKTQKSIRPSLKDTLMYLIASTGIEGIPIIEKEMWRAESAPLAIDLQFNDDSPLKDQINISGAKGLGRPIQLASFVTSIKPMMKRNEEFRALAYEDRLGFLKAYWNVVSEMYPNAFREDLRSEYLILRAIGVYSMNWLANDVFNWCQDEGIDVPSEEEIGKFLEPLKGFNWSREDSTLAAFGGMKGVKEAHKLLLGALAHQGIDKALKSLKEMELSKSEIDTVLAMAVENLRS